MFAFLKNNSVPGKQMSRLTGIESTCLGRKRAFWFVFFPTFVSHLRQPQLSHPWGVESKAFSWAPCTIFCRPRPRHLARRGVFPKPLPSPHALAPKRSEHLPLNPTSSTHHVLRPPSPPFSSGLPDTMAGSSGQARLLNNRPLLASVLCHESPSRHKAPRSSSVQGHYLLPDPPHCPRAAVQSGHLSIGSSARVLQFRDVQSEHPQRKRF